MTGVAPTTRIRHLVCAWGCHVQRFAPVRHIHGDYAWSKFHDDPSYEILRANEVDHRHGVTDRGIPFLIHILLGVENEREFGGGDTVDSLGVWLCSEFLDRGVVVFCLIHSAKHVNLREIVLDTLKSWD